MIDNCNPIKRRFSRRLFGIDDAVLIGAGASILSSTIGGAFGQKSQSDTNDTNYQIAKETNEQNYKIWQEQQEHNKEMFELENQANIDMFNMQNQANIDMYNMQNEDAIEMFNMQNQAAIDMWRMQNAYNDPAAQIQRLQSAGLNPVLAMNNSGTASGSNSSAPQVGNLSPATAPQSSSLTSAKATPAQAIAMQMPPTMADEFSAGWSKVVDSFGVIGKALVDYKKAGSDIGVNNAIIADLGEKVEGMKLDNKFKKAQSVYFDQLAKNQAKISDLSVSAAELNNDVMRARLASMDINLKTQKLQYLYLGPTLAAETNLKQYQASRELVALGIDIETADALIARPYLENMAIAADIDLKKAEAACARALGGKYAAETSLMNIDLQLIRDNWDVYKERFAKELKVDIAEADMILDNLIILKEAAGDSAQAMLYQAEQDKIASLASLKDFEGLLDEEGDGSNWWYYGTEVVGNGLRKALGGLLAPYDVNDGIRINSDRKDKKAFRNRRRVGFLP